MSERDPRDETLDQALAMLKEAAEYLLDDPDPYGQREGDRIAAFLAKHGIEVKS